MRKLTGKQARYLRGLGHHLKPVVMLGKNDVDERLLAEVNQQLAIHELIKVKMQESCGLDRHEAAEMLAEASDAAIAQILGRTFLLYRPGEAAKIQLP